MNSVKYDYVTKSGEHLGVTELAAISKYYRATLLMEYVVENKLVTVDENKLSNEKYYNEVLSLCEEAIDLKDERVLTDAEAIEEAKRKIKEIVVF